MLKNLIIILLTFSLYSESEVYSRNWGSLDTFSVNGHVQAVIEIPAGTNIKLEYDYAVNKFQPDRKDGRNRIIDFLPYPGNYGFIPSTMINKKMGGDGDSLDILVISESVPSGSVIEIIPIALLNLIDNGEIDSKIIAIPLNKKDRVISAISFSELNNNYPNIEKLIKLWFTSYKGQGVVKFDGWYDEDLAMAEINKWIQN